MNRLEFITGRFYSPDQDQVIKAIEIGTFDHFDFDAPPNKIIFVDEVRQIAGVIKGAEFTQSTIMRYYDKCCYEIATSKEVALVG